MIPKIRSARRGVSYMEVLAAVLILAAVAAGAVATWTLSSKIPGNKRVTDMASVLAVREVETVKAKKYLNISDGTTVKWYDKNGSLLGTGGSAPSGTVYKSSTVVSVVINRDSTTNSEDLREIVVTVTDSGATKTYETQRTLITFGGI